MKLKDNFKTHNITRLARVCVIATTLMLTLLPATAFAQLGQQPQNTTVAPGGTASFTYLTMIYGTLIGTQWQVSTNSGITWTNISNGGNYSGATTSTLTVSNVPATFNGYRYRCNVSYLMPSTTSPTTATSSVATLTVATPPTITSSTMFWYSQAGTPFSISLTATGTTPITWSIVSGSLPTGVTLNPSTGVISGTPTVYGSFTFRVRATNIAGYDEATYTLPVSPPPPQPSIVTHPVNRTITAGSNTTFSITTSTVEQLYLYQWQYRTNSSASWNNVTNGGIYSNATTATLSLSNVPISYNGYQYRCIASINYPRDTWSETSNAATLTVLSAGTPPTITTTSLPNGTRSTNYSAALAATGTTPITWSIISGSLPTGLTLNESSGIISGTPSAVGTFTFTVRASNRINPDATRAFTIVIQEMVYPSISSHPADRSITEGTGTTFSVAAINCTGSFSYQWQYRVNANGTWTNVSNGGNYSGATTTTLTLSSGVTISYTGYQYRCVVICSAMPNYVLNSNPGTLTVTAAPTPPVITKHPDDVSIKEGTPGASFAIIAANCTGSFSYQWQYRTSVSGTWANVTNTGIYSGATTPTLMLSSGVTFAYTGYQYRCTASCSTMPNSPVSSNAGTLTVTRDVAVIELIPDAQTFCSVLDYIKYTFRKLDNEHQIRYNITFSEAAKAVGFQDKTAFENLPADLLLLIDIPPNIPTGMYSGVVNVECEGVTDLIENYPFSFMVINNGVTIVSQPPAYQSLCGGASIALVVDVSGDANSYQWYKNDQPIAGAENKDFTVETEGNYYVEIWGECGAIKSDVAVISSPSSSPAGISVRVKWGNLLYVENASNKYQSYQWYHNGSAINGATFVYLSEKEGFLGEYYARCFKADGSYEETCPIVFTTRTKSSAVSVYPTVLKTSDLLNINLTDTDLDAEATVEIYSLLGILSYSTKITPPLATIKPDFLIKGTYIVKIKLPSGDVVSEKIIVQ